jgi:PPP family 3-phenylpropionic acid transporter
LTAARLPPRRRAAEGVHASPLDSRRDDPHPSAARMRSDAARLSLYLAAAFSFLGVNIPFWPAWLEGRGMTTAQIGALSASWAWSRGIASPVWAHFVDRSGRRRIWIVSLGWAAAACFVPFAFSRSFGVLLALTVLLGSVHAPVFPLAENQVVLLERERRLAYGPVRVWGSIGFLAAATLAGTMLDDGRGERTYALVLATLVLGALASLAIPETTTPPPPVARKLPLRDVLSQRTLVLALAGSGIVQASHAPYYVFSTLHWKAAGHSTTAIGALWSEGVLAEMVLFLAASRLVGRFGPVRLMQAAVAGALLRWTALASSTDVAVLAGVQWMHALSFGAAHVATMSFLGRAVPQERSATAMSVYGMFNIAAHVLTVAAITPVFDLHGGLAFLPMGALAALGGGLAIAGMRGR